MPQTFSCATRIVAGAGSVSGLSAELDGLAARTAGFICDRGVADAGLLEPILAAAGCSEESVLAYVDPEPTVGDAEAAAETAHERRVDAVVAVGGGSGLCVGKAVAIRLRNDKPLREYAGRDRLERSPATCIAIPTTAGSGSEVSNALVLHDPDSSAHLVVRGVGYEPVLAILDGELVKTVPRGAMVAAGLDALSHALEALWARGASTFTDALALAAARQIFEIFPRALEHRELADLQALLEASTMANLACGSAGLGLVHALSSYSELHLPHGYQNGVLMPHVAEYNRPCLRLEVLPLIDGIEELYASIDFRGSFRADELTAAAAQGVVAVARENPFHANNLRSSTDDDLWGILAAAGVPVSDGRSNYSHRSRERGNHGE